MRKVCTSCVDLLRLTKGVFEIKYPRKSKCLHCLLLVQARVSLPKWRNWQTRYVQGVVRVPSCGFKSHLRHYDQARREAGFLPPQVYSRSEEHTSELQSPTNLV